MNSINQFDWRFRRLSAYLSSHVRVSVRVCAPDCQRVFLLFRVRVRVCVVLSPIFTRLFLIWAFIFFYRGCILIRVDNGLFMGGMVSGGGCCRSETRILDLFETYVIHYRMTGNDSPRVSRLVFGAK